MNTYKLRTSYNFVYVAPYGSAIIVSSSFDVAERRVRKMVGAMPFTLTYQGNISLKEIKEREEELRKELEIADEEEVD